MKHQRHFQAAMQANGVYSVIKRAFCSRFSSIRAFVLVPSKSEKLTLEVSFKSRNLEDHVLLTRRNWRTGEESILYDGNFMGGEPIKKRHLRD